MNIAFVIGTFPTLSETFIVNQILALQDKGYDVDILAYKRGETEILHQNIIDHNLLNNVHYFNITPPSKLKRIQFLFLWLNRNFFLVNWSLFFKSLNVFKYGNLALSLNLFYKSLWFLNKIKYDIIHVHFGHNAILIADLKEKGFLKNTKLIVSFHGFDLLPNGIQQYKLIYNQLFGQADVLTVNTLYTKNILLNVDDQLKNVFVLPVGLDTQFFSKTNKVKNEIFTIVYCGRLVPFKGAILALNILSELIKKEYKHIRLEIIGEGILETELKQKIKMLELESYVTLHGALNQDEVKLIMNNSNMFLLPGITEEKTFRAENQGLVIQEAQAMELPVVISDAGGMKYGILPNESGYVIKENDINEFTKTIEKLINNRELCETIGKRGREFVVKHFDNEVLVNKLIDIYFN